MAGLSECVCKGRLGYARNGVRVQLLSSHGKLIRQNEVSKAVRLLVQRVRQARVRVADRITGEIGAGLVIFVGVGKADTSFEVDLLSEKIVNLRIFGDESGKSNLSALDTRAEILVVSQFTLFADCRRGRRPSFTDAAGPDLAAPLIEAFVARLRQFGFRVETGEFQADMLVELQNSGPVTIWLDSDDFRRTRSTP